MRNNFLVLAVLGLTTVALAQTSGQATTSSTTSAQTGQTGASANTNTNTGVYGGGGGAQTQGSANTGANANVQAGQTGASVSTSGNADAQRSRSNNSANSSTSGSGSIASGTTIPATLSKGVDAKKAKQGDEVTAKTTQDVRSAGSVVIPKGSKLVGHVTEAHAKGNGQSDSALGIAFDHAVLKNGQQVPFTATIQAVAAAANTASAGMDDSGFSTPSGPSGNMGSSASGGPLGGVGNTVGGAANTVGNTAGGVAGGAANTVGNTAGNVGGAVGSTAAGAGGTLTSNSRGVVGLTGYTLSSATSSSTNGSVITSTQKNVKLDSGTQLLLQVSGTQQ